MRKSHRVAHEDQRRGGFCCYYYTSFDVIVKDPFTVLPLSQYIMCHSLTLSVVICPFHVLHFSYISQIFLHILILYALYHSVFAAIQDKLPVDGAVTVLGLGVFQILFHFLSRYNKNGEVPAITLRRKPNRFEHNMLD